MPIERAFARVVIKAMIPEGFSQRAIMREVRRLGYGYRTKTMGSDIRRLSGRYLNEGYVKKLDPAAVVPKDLMVEGELKRSFKYRIHGDATYLDRDTGEYITQKGSLYTDRYISKEGMERDFIEKKPRPRTPPRYMAVGFDVTSVEHNEGFDY